MMALWQQCLLQKTVVDQFLDGSKQPLSIAANSYMLAEEAI